MSSIHVGESAELYALGLLSEAEATAMQTHAAGCTQCRRLIGEAEDTVLALEREAQPVSAPAALGNRIRFERRSVRMPQWTAVAAAFLLGILPGAWLAAQHVGGPAQHDAAAVAMVNDHFSHAQFVPVSAPAPNAKLIYARNRSWFYIIVAGTHRYQAFAARGNAVKSLGFTAPGSTSSELFVAEAPAADSIVLRDGDAVIERVKLP